MVSSLVLISITSCRGIDRTFHDTKTVYPTICSSEDFDRKPTNPLLEFKKEYEKVIPQTNRDFVFAVWKYFEKQYAEAISNYEARTKQREDCRKIIEEVNKKDN